MITMSNLGEILIIYSFDIIQMLLKIYINLMIDSATLEFKRLLLMMYRISKIFRYDFD